MATAVSSVAQLSLHELSTPFSTPSPRPAFTGSCEYYANGVTDITPPPPRSARQIASEIKVGFGLRSPSWNNLTVMPDDRVIKDLFFKINSHNALAPADSVGNMYPTYRFNRHQNVVPHDYCRLTVMGSQYINASPVLLLGNCYIATQAPIDETMGHFVALVSEQKVDTIVTLAMPIEKGEVKALDYWTQSAQSSRVLMEEGDERVVERMLLMDNRQVRQLHYENWPDHGAPKTDLFKKILEEANSENPLLVHCSAGIGRTGSFIVAHSIIRSQVPLNQSPLVETALRARHFRPGTITTPVQLKAVIEVIRASKQ
ncbi:MAG: tyrosine-protein phosphatase [Chlamydiia bacterium]|nr:tyrosine-protein phosphatase [Chlamydiia bacterium]